MYPKYGEENTVALHNLILHAVSSRALETGTSRQMTFVQFIYGRLSLCNTYIVYLQ